MAGDWIKIRSSLSRHPKVVRIASALIADTERTRVLLQAKRPAVTLAVGALTRMFSVFDEQSVDGRLDGYGCSDLDDEVGVVGFAAQVIAIGWLQDDGTGLTMPEFSTHNGASAKRRAQDADRKRAERSLQPDGVPDPSAPHADRSGTRKENKRKDSVGGKPPTTRGAGAPAGDGDHAGDVGGQQEHMQTRGQPTGGIEMADCDMPLPDWLQPHAKVWAAFQEIRRKKNSKAPYTRAAQDGIVAKLLQFHTEGQDLREVLQNSVDAGWTSVFPLRGARRMPAASFTGKNYSGGDLEHDFAR